jgi:carbon-monoxide dehydrogenase large subunit
MKLDLFALAGKQPESEIFMESTSAIAGPSWPNGGHICEVEIDPATGEVAVALHSKGGVSTEGFCAGSWL